MAEKLLKSPAGAEPVMTLDGDRLEKLRALQLKLEECLRLQPKKAQLEKAALAALKSGDLDKAREAVEKSDLASRKTLEKLKADVEFLSKPYYQVVCPKTKVMVHAPTEVEAAATWNKAVVKFAELKDCCKDPANQEVKTDAAGMTIVKCLVCGVRHVPFTE